MFRFNDHPQGALILAKVIINKTVS